MGVSTRPRRRLDAVRRPQILRSAVDMVREKGLWEVRISDVAKRAGVSPASVVYYFGTKDQLFAQAIASADDAFYEAIVCQGLGGLAPAHLGNSHTSLPSPRSSLPTPRPQGGGPRLGSGQGFGRGVRNCHPGTKIVARA